MDKQFVREYLKRLNVDLLSPEKTEHLLRVCAIEIPPNIRRMTTKLYRYAFWRLVGQKLEAFQREQMGIDVHDPKPGIEIVIGSASDDEELEAGLRLLSGNADYRLTVMSCHRNDDREETLERFVRNELVKADIVIASAGMAAALPGIIKTKLCKYGCPEIPVIGVAFRRKNVEADVAAKLSIKCLPGQPVELDSNGDAYFGPEGFEVACASVLEDEFYPKPIEAKPAKIGEWMS